jgi:gamma-aminobutyric acid receptor subunit beta
MIEIQVVEATIGRKFYDAYERYVSTYDFNISAERIKAYYFWKVILPLCLIVAMSWCVFWINPAQYGPQIGLSATSMLTLIAFIFATTNMVPRLGYLTLLDRFIVFSTILVFLALVESLTTVYLVSKEKKELALRIDNMSRFVFPIIFGVIIITVLIV